MTSFTTKLLSIYCMWYRRVYTQCKCYLIVPIEATASASPHSIAPIDNNW